MKYLLQLLFFVINFFVVVRSFDFTVRSIIPGNCTAQLCIPVAMYSYLPLTDFGFFDEDPQPLRVGQLLSKTKVPQLDSTSSIYTSEGIHVHSTHQERSQLEYWFTTLDLINTEYSINIHENCSHVGCIYEPSLTILDDLPLSLYSLIELNEGHKSWFTLNYIEFFIYEKHSSFIVETNADVFVYIDDELVIYIPTTLYTHTTKAIDFPSLFLKLDHVYLIRIFIASRLLQPRFISIQSTLNRARVARSLIPVLTASSPNIDFYVSISGSSISFPTSPYQPSSLFHPDSTSLLFEFYPEDTGVFMNILKLDSYGMEKVGTIYRQDTKGDLQVFLCYFTSFHMLAVVVNNVLLWSNNTFVMGDVLQSKKSSISLYTPIGYQQNTLILSDFRFSIPNLSYSNTYILYDQTITSTASNYLILHIHLHDETDSPFLSLDNYMYNLIIEINRINGTETLNYFIQEFYTTGVISVYFYGKIAGYYTISIRMNDNILKYKNHTDYFTFTPDIPDISRSSVVLSSVLKNHPRAGTLQYIDIYLSDIYNNHYHRLYNDLNMYITNYDSGNQYSFIIPAGTAAEIVSEAEGFQGNTYRFRLYFQLEMIGTYSTLFLYNYVKLHSSESFIIYPNSVSRDESLIWGSLLDGIIVDKNEYLTILLHDNYGNLINDTTLSLDISVTPENNSTSSQTTSLHQFSCSIQYNIFICPITLSITGTATITVIQEEVFHRLTNILQSDLESRLFTRYTTIKAGDPICKSLVVDEGYVPSSAGPEFVLLHFQYYDKYRNIPVIPVAETEQAIVLYDNQPVTCYETESIGSMHCAIPTFTKGYHVVLIKCQNDIVYKRVLSLDCYDSSINANMTAETSDDELSLLFDLYDIYNNQCTHHLSSLYTIIRDLNNNYTRQVTLSFDFYKQKYAYTFTPEHTTSYEISLYNHGKLIFTTIIPYVTSYDKPVTFDNDMKFLGEGMNGGFIYTPLNIYIAMNTNDSQSIVEKHMNLMFYTFDECSFSNRTFQEYVTHTGSASFYLQTYIHYIRYTNSQDYFSNLSQEEIDERINRGEATNIYLKRTDRCINVDNITVYSSPSAYSSPLIYAGEGRYVVNMQHLSTQDYFVSLFLQSSNMNAVFMISSQYHVVNRMSLEFLSDYESVVYLIDEPITIQFRIRTLYSNQYVTDETAVNESVHASVFQAHVILYPSIYVNEEEQLLEFTFTPIYRHDVTDENANTVVLISVDSLAYYLYIRTTSIVPSIQDSIVVSDPLCREEGSLCGLFMSSIYKNNYLYLYLKDRHGNKVNISPQDFNLTIYRMFQWKFELFIPSSLNITNVDYGIYKLYFPSVRYLLLCSTDYLIHTQVPTEDNHGDEVDTDTFTKYHLEYVHRLTKYPLKYMKYYAITYIYINKQEVQMAYTYNQCQQITVNNVEMKDDGDRTVGNKVYLMFIYTDPLLSICNNVRNDLYVTITSSTGVQRTPLVMLFENEGIEYVCDFIPEDAGIYTVEISFEESTSYTTGIEGEDGEDGSIATDILYKQFTIEIYQSLPSLSGSYFFEEDNINLQINHEYTLFLTILDSIDLPVNISALSIPVFGLLYGNEQGYDFIQEMPIHTYNYTHSYISISLINKYNYKLFICLPTDVSSSIYSFMYQYISITAISQDTLCPPILAPNNKTLCPITQECVENGYDCEGMCYLPFTLKCPYVSSESNVISSICVLPTEHCSCEDAGLYSCLPSSSLQAPLCAADENTCIHLDLCSSTSQVMCWDYTCANDIKYCPSIIICPPGYVHCLDNVHCAPSFDLCPSLPIPSIICPPELPLLCPDLEHCSNNIYTCPSMIHCPDDHYLCPNLECVTDVSECEVLPECDVGLHQCFDGSCVASYKECPQLPSCPAGMKLCENRECVSIYSDCTDIYKDISIYKETYHLIRCPSGDVTDNREKCPNSIVCPSNTYKCPDDSCIPFGSTCATVTTCPDGLIWCPSGGCGPSIRFCGRYPKCPRGDLSLGSMRPAVLCSNLLCRSSLEECDVPEICPKERPIRCPTGICVDSSAFCIPPRFCPYEVPISCDDGSCAESVEACSSGDICPPGYYLCPSGTCAPQMELCPSVTMCLPPSIRCYDSSCRSFSEAKRLEDVGEPPDYEPCVNTYLHNHKFAPCTCNDVSLVYCGDQCLPLSQCPLYDELYYQCVTSKMTLVKELCSQQYTNYPCPISSHYDIFHIPSPYSTFCPSSAPFLCSDRTCHTSLSMCSLESTCNTYQVLCKDGSCKHSYSECNSVPVCPSSAPYLCPSNRCMPMPEDCLDMDICPDDKPYRCFNNVCVDSQQQCDSLPVCSPREILCHDYNCYTSLNLTSTLYIYRLPALFENPCNAVSINNCPHGYQRCYTGACVLSLSQCTEHTCPIYAPYECPDGTCTSDLENCRELCSNPIFCPVWDVQSNSVIYQRTCCSTTYEECCYPRDYPYLEYLPPITQCEAGTVLCGDGTCREQLNCINADGCPTDWPYKCISGNCVANMNECTDEYLCPAGQFRCSNGKCVTSYLFCTWFHNQQLVCNGYKPIRCADGTCVTSYSECLSLVDCSNDHPYRCNKDKNECNDISTCSPLVPIRVQRGRYQGMCSSTVNYDLLEAVSICSHETPYLCSNNLCQSSAMSCAQVETECPVLTPYQCPNGQCVKTKGDCLTLTSCPPDTPYRCRNLVCVQHPSYCASQSLFSEDTIQQSSNPYISVPYVCPDGSLVTTLLECNTAELCPASTPYRCRDGTCIARDESTGIFQCNAYVNCPSYAPAKCEDGSCARLPSFCPYFQTCKENFQQCSDTTCSLISENCQYTNSVCPVGNPVKCMDGSCVRNGNDCISDVCPENKPYKCFFGTCVATPSECPQYPCRDGQTQCWDGSCVESAVICPSIPACPANVPTRCFDGSCVTHPVMCPIKYPISCPTGTTLCASGLCSEECENYYGCKVGQYMCSNSTCITIPSSLYSNQTSISSYCLNTCRGATCTDRTLYTGDSIHQITLSLESNVPIPTVFADYREILTIYIPEKLMKNQLQDYVLFVSTVPTSRIQTLYGVHENNETQISYLTLAESILSPMILIDLRHNYHINSTIYTDDFRLPLVLYFIIPKNTIDVRHICLAYRNVSYYKWDCVSPVYYNQKHYVGSITHPGIYALLYSPVYIQPDEDSLLSYISFIYTYYYI
ncbi:hypothetical protein WA158_005722 [Blastocystis sp. Blastoise]